MTRFRNALTTVAIFASFFVLPLYTYLAITS